MKTINTLFSQRHLQKAPCLKIYFIFNRNYRTINICNAPHRVRCRSNGSHFRVLISVCAIHIVLGVRFLKIEIIGSYLTYLKINITLVVTSCSLYINNAIILITLQHTPDDRSGQNEKKIFRRFILNGFFNFFLFYIKLKTT
jgi:hypothetical protein